MTAVAERIPMEAVESSNLASIGYHDEKRILAVQFKSSGAIYHYAGVDPETMAQFETAPSRGAFFARQIKGKFTGQKMTGECNKCGDGPGWKGTVCEGCGCGEYSA